MSFVSSANEGQQSVFFTLTSKSEPSCVAALKILSMDTKFEHATLQHQSFDIHRIYIGHTAHLFFRVRPANVTGVFHFTFASDRGLTLEAVRGAVSDEFSIWYWLQAAMFKRSLRIGKSWWITRVMNSFVIALFSSTTVLVVWRGEVKIEVRNTQSGRHKQIHKLRVRRHSKNAWALQIDRIHRHKSRSKSA